MVKLCAYGCGQEAKHQFKNGKWCCESHTSKCPEMKKIDSLRLKQNNPMRGKRHSKESKLKMSIAKKGSNHPVFGKHLSEETKKKISLALKGRIFCEESKKRMSLSHKNKPSIMKGKHHTKETKKKISLIIKEKYCSEDYKQKVSLAHKLSISQIKEKHPFFAKVEEMRYNPDKPGEKELQVHCKNHNCPNSKEQNGWFTPTRTQLHERIRNLENPLGTEGSYFYCSEKCKNECPLFNLVSDPNQNKEMSYTLEEYQTWRNKVLERDNYECQICGSKENLHVHHIQPQKLEPFFALDPDNGICLCEKCHYKYGHKDECSTGNLSNKICTENLM